MKRPVRNRILVSAACLGAAVMMIGAAGCEFPDFEVTYVSSGGFIGVTNTLHIQPLSGFATYESDFYPSFTFTLTEKEAWVLSTLFVQAGFYDLPGRIVAQCPGWDTFHYSLSGIDGDRGVSNVVTWEDDFCGSNPDALLELRAVLEQLISDYQP